MKKVVVLFMVLFAFAGSVEACCGSGLPAVGDERPVVQQELPNTPVRQDKRRRENPKKCPIAAAHHDDDDCYGKWAPFHFTTPFHSGELEKI